MSRAPVNEEVTKFVGGLVTDSNLVNSPQNTTRDEQNMLLVTDGTRARRLGVDLEDGGDATFVAADPAVGFPATILPVVNDHRVVYWGEATLNSDRHLAFLSKSQGVFVGNDTSAPTSDFVDAEVSFFANGDGSAYIAGELLLTSGTVFVDSVGGFYSDQATTRFREITRQLNFRDIWGIDDGLVVTNRPVALVNFHAYNLLNQGWEVDQINQFFTDMAVYPSNADLPTFGLNTTTGVYVPNLLKEVPAPNGAPKGKYIISLASASFRESACNTDILALGLTNPFTGTAERQNLSGSFVFQYANRVFWINDRAFNIAVDSFTKTPNLASYIFFSKVVEEGINDADMASGNSAISCFSHVSPTSSDFVPLSTDGGFLPLPNASKILAGAGTSEGVFIFASKGVWLIKSQLNVFDPTQIAVEELTSIGAISSKVVTARNSVYYLSGQGIIRLSYNEDARRVIPQNISEGITSLYSSLVDSIVAVTYDETRDRVHWMFHPLDNETGGVRTYKQIELVFDLRFNAWTKNRFNDYTTNVSDVMDADQLAIFDYSPIESNFVASSSTPVDTARLTSGVKRAYMRTPVGYIPSDPSSAIRTFYYGLATEQLTTYQDWNSYGLTTDANGFLVTQHDTDGESQRRRTGGHLVAHFNRTEKGYQDDGGGNPELINPGGCLLQTRWDYAANAASNKFSPDIQLYQQKRPYFPASTTDPGDTSFDVLTSKRNIRGRGRALQLNFKTEPGKDLQMLGWGITKQINRRQ